MKTIAFLVVLPVGLAYPQQAPEPTPAAVGAAVEKTVDETASPELVGHLVKDLAITPAQAEGAAGALFGVAKTRLSAEEFAKVGAAVPNMEGLLKAAPAAAADAKATGASAADAVLTKAAASASGTVAAAGALSKLGLNPATIAKAAPSLIKAVETKGGAEVANLLARALK